MHVHHEPPGGVTVIGHLDVPEEQVRAPSIAQVLRDLRDAPAERRNRLPDLVGRDPPGAQNEHLHAEIVTGDERHQLPPGRGGIRDLHGREDLDVPERRRQDLFSEGHAANPDELAILPICGVPPALQGVGNAAGLGIEPSGPRLRLRPAGRIHGPADGGELHGVVIDRQQRPEDPAGYGLSERSGSVEGYAEHRSRQSLAARSMHDSDSQIRVETLYTGHTDVCMCIWNFLSVPNAPIADRPPNQNQRCKSTIQEKTPDSP